MNVNVYPLPKAADPNDQGEPELVSEAGNVHEWLLESDMTAYRAIVVRVGAEGTWGLNSFVRPGLYVMVTVAGGGEREGYQHQRWGVSGGGAWYGPFREGDFLALDYVQEKFRLNEVDGYHTQRLLTAALRRAV